jgi:hypothetical protein
MQASLYGKSGILPTLSRTLHLESGILGKCGLSVDDDITAIPDDFFLVVFIFGSFYQIKLRQR